MRTIGNILWFLLAGLWLAIGYAIVHHDHRHSVRDREFQDGGAGRRPARQRDRLEGRRARAGILVRDRLPA